MVLIPISYCQVSHRMTLVGMARPAYITYGGAAGGVSDPVALANAFQVALAGGIASQIDNGVQLGPTLIRLGIEARRTIGATKNPPPEVRIAERKHSLIFREGSAKRNDLIKREHRSD